jgi:hypothetical protein
MEALAFSGTRRTRYASYDLVDKEYARQRFVDVFQIGWNIEREYWEEKT